MAHSPVAAALRRCAGVAARPLAVALELYTLLPAAARAPATHRRMQSRRAPAPRPATGERGPRAGARSGRTRHRACERAALRARYRSAPLHPAAPGLAVVVQVVDAGALFGADRGDRRRRLARRRHRRTRGARAAARRGNAGPARWKRPRAGDRPFRGAQLARACRIDAPGAGVRRRRLGADAHRGSDGHSGGRIVRSQRRGRVGSVAGHAPDRRVDRTSVPALRQRRLRRRQSVRVPDHAARRTRPRGAE